MNNSTKRNSINWLDSEKEGGYQRPKMLVSKISERMALSTSSEKSKPYPSCFKVVSVVDNKLEMML